MLNRSLRPGRRELLENLTFQRYTAQILLALAFLHQKKLIHRDLKPANLLLELTTQTLKLADLGLTTTAEGRREARVGTWFYFAPEMAFGAKGYSSAVGKYTNSNKHCNK